MVKYPITATVLQLFSCCSIMRRLYRFLGNTYGMRKRLTGDIPSYYIERIKRLLHLCTNYNVINDGDRIIEVGTGWFHWEAITIKLFFDIEAILFDVWDNRQFVVLKRYISLLDGILDHKIDLNNAQRARAHRIIRQIISADSFDTLYKRIGFQYVIDSTGSLRDFPEQSFDVVISAGVLEHIKKDILSTFIQDFYRLLKPGGYSIHSINIADHLYAYDTSVCRKEYLRFSDTVWKLFFQNDVQYVNRVQRSEWMTLFDKVGLQLVSEQTEYSTIRSMKVHKQFGHLDKKDIECTSLNIVHQRASFSDLAN